MDWDYAIRTNYTYPFQQGEDDTVPCLYPDCDFTYTIPSTQVYTQDLYKPQSMEFLYGYSYSGFNTLQVVMDRYIFAQYPTDTDIGGEGSSAGGVHVMASLGMMPTVKFQSDDFQYVIASTLGIFYMLSFLYPVSRLIRGLVLEKVRPVTACSSSGHCSNT